MNSSKDRRVNSMLILENSSRRDLADLRRLSGRLNNLLFDTKHEANLAWPYYPMCSSKNISTDSIRPADLSFCLNQDSCDSMVEATPLRWKRVRPSY